VIDLGNNMNRFGLWDDPVNWKAIFDTPELYLDRIPSDDEIEAGYRYVMPDELRAKFGKSENIDFDIIEEHRTAIREMIRPKTVIEKSILQHLNMCLENSTNVDEALHLADLLREEIEYRVRVYTRCLHKTSESYVKWLQDDYKRTLKVSIIRMAHTTAE
jgi:hypothetical protein